MDKATMDIRFSGSVTNQTRTSCCDHSGPGGKSTTRQPNAMRYTRWGQPDWSTPPRPVNQELALPRKVTEHKRYVVRRLENEDPVHWVKRQWCSKLLSNGEIFQAPEHFEPDTQRWIPVFPPMPLGWRPPQEFYICLDHWQNTQALCTRKSRWS